MNKLSMQFESLLFSLQGFVTRKYNFKKRISLSLIEQILWFTHNGQILRHKLIFCSNIWAVSSIKFNPIPNLFINYLDSNNGKSLPTTSVLIMTLAGIQASCKLKTCLPSLNLNIFLLYLHISIFMILIQKIIVAIKPYFTKYWIPMAYDIVCYKQIGYIAVVIFFMFLFKCIWLIKFSVWAFFKPMVNPSIFIIPWCVLKSIKGISPMVFIMVITMSTTPTINDIWFLKLNFNCLLILFPDMIHYFFLKEDVEDSFFILFFSNEVHSVEGPEVTQCRRLQCKKQFMLIGGEDNGQTKTWIS